MGTTPVVILAKSSAGISADTKDRKVGAADEPDEGPAKTVLIACAFQAKVNVPDVVTGDPVTVNWDGADRPTEVTEPLAAGAAQVTLPPTTVRTLPFDPTASRPLLEAPRTIRS